MRWNFIDSENKIEEIIKISNENPVLVFKHSTRCGISKSVLNTLQLEWKEDEVKNIKAYMLDLLNYRNLSNQIAEEFKVEHESPQVLIIDKGKCIKSASHYSISYDMILNAIIARELFKNS